MVYHDFVGLETVDCEFRAAEKCLLHFGEILSHGQLGPICRFVSMYSPTCISKHPRDNQNVLA